jgi:hypothetical protein
MILAVIAVIRVATVAAGVVLLAVALILIFFNPGPVSSQALGLS